MMGVIKGDTRTLDSSTDTKLICCEVGPDDPFQEALCPRKGDAKGRLSTSSDLTASAGL